MKEAVIVSAARTPVGRMRGMSHLWKQLIWELQQLKRQ